MKKSQSIILKTLVIFSCFFLLVVGLLRAYFGFSNYQKKGHFDTVKKYVFSEAFKTEIGEEFASFSIVSKPLTDLDTAITVLKIHQRTVKVRTIKSKEEYYVLDYQVLE